ncbi:hypothetical protein [Nitrospira sp. BLG_2]|uniref:hypothetical protein n=1 Tax=Nitrospira sp. BLG_2 TaxID=3397507 RepID=UPI003B9AA164
MKLCRVTVTKSKLTVCMLSLCRPDASNRVVEFNKRGCKELETFGGGTLSLTGKGHKSVSGEATKTLRMDLKRSTVQS